MLSLVGGMVDLRGTIVFVFSFIYIHSLHNLLFLPPMFHEFIHSLHILLSLPTILTTFSSLLATIKEVRPDLLPEHESSSSNKIPDEAPPRFFNLKTANYVNGIGEPASACFFTKENVDPTNWYLSPFFPYYASINLVFIFYI